jgi:hypothetical protein
VFAEGLRRLPSTAHRGASFLLSRGLQLNRETLHHQSDRSGNTVQVYPLRIQRQYTRFRRPGRQPPHPGRYRYQSARFRGAPPAHDVFIPRCSAEHLAGVIRGYRVPTRRWVLPDGERWIPASFRLLENCDLKKTACAGAQSSGDARSLGWDVSSETREVWLRR